MKNNIENVISFNELKKSNDVVIYKNEVFYYFDTGLSRKVYVNEEKTKVIKIEINDYPYHNKKEFEIYKNSNQKDLMCFTEYVNELNIIIQDFVIPLKFANETLKSKLTIKDFVFASSCRNEVGFDKNNKLICFDLDEFKKY